MELIVQDERRIHSAMHKFLDGQDLPANLVPKPVERSWIRLRDAGVEPGSRARFEADEGVMRRDFPDQASSLVDAAMPAMQNLRRSLGSPNWAVLCIDRSGTIVSSLFDGKCSFDALTRSLQNGRTVSESNVGTNAPACVLEDRKPVIVHGAQHFLQDLKHYRCVASPIFGPDGELVGALDVTGLGVEIHPWLIDQVLLSARQIENSLFRKLDGARLVGLHHMREFLGTAAEGVLALDDQGRVIAGNRAACKMLESDVRSIRGTPVDRLLDRFSSRFSARAVDETVLPNSSGNMLYARLYSQSSDVSRASARTTVCVPSRGPLVAEPAVASLTEKARRAYARGLPVLILGETGTGKEVLARTLHLATKPGRPFIAVNCSAIPENLIESEVFGYADGAFTGARKGGAQGLIEQASGGTLFLDEIGDAPLQLQAKLLRVLQEGTLRRLGSQQEIKVDLSVVSATHRDIQKMIGSGEFREDLFYRLNGVALTLPPLRARLDVSDLIHSFLEQFAAPGERPKMSQAAMDALRAYSWPGNIRQLQQVVRASLALADDVEAIDISDLPMEIAGRQPVPAAATGADAASLSEAQTDLIQKTLESMDYNVAKTARALKISRTTIYNRMRKSVGGAATH
jgi:transcriptional regulator of acetoin/glycerol metabolism